METRPTSLPEIRNFFVPKQEDIYFTYLKWLYATDDENYLDYESFETTCEEVDDMLDELVAEHAANQIKISRKECERNLLKLFQDNIVFVLRGIGTDEFSFYASTDGDSENLEPPNYNRRVLVIVLNSMHEFKKYSRGIRKKLIKCTVDQYLKSKKHYTLEDACKCLPKIAKKTCCIYETQI